jgi:Tfp pilus assembly protein PilF
MSLILDALKRARELAQGKSGPVQAEALFNSFGFRPQSKKARNRRILVYLLPVVIVGVTIAASLRYWAAHRSSKVQTIAAVNAAPIRAPEPVPVPQPATSEPPPVAIANNGAGSPVTAPPSASNPSPVLPLDRRRTPPALPKSVAAPRNVVIPAQEPTPSVTPNPAVSQPQNVPAAPAASTNDSVIVSVGTRDPWELAMFYYRTGEPEKAVILYRQILEKDPLNARVLNNMGAAYLALGNNNEAIKTFRSATVATPAYDAAHNNLGTALMNAGQNSEAEREFKRALSLNARSTDALINLGRLAKNTNSPEQAKTYYLKALQINGSSAEAHYNVAQIYEEQKENTQAVQHYQAFLDLASQQYASLVPQVEAKIRELNKLRLP